MRRNLFLLAGFLTLAHLSFCQSELTTDPIDYGKLRLAVRFGGNLSSDVTIIDGTSQDTKFKSCLQGGVYAVVRQSERFQTTIGLSLVEKGDKFSISGINGKASRLYFQFDGTESYFFVNKPSFGLFFEVGPYLSLGWKSRSSNDYMSGVLNSYGNNGSERRFDCGYILGVGGEFGQHFTLNADMTYGIINLSKADKSTMKNLTLQLVLGYKF